MRRLALLALVAGLVAASLGLAATAEAQRLTRWNVEVTNLTSGQPFSAPLWAVHTRRLHVWSVGEQATNGHTLIAEDALNGPLEALLDSDRRVRDAATGLPPPSDPPTAPPVPPGASREFTVESRGSFNRLSTVWMLVRTNDAFSGLDSLRLRPRRRQTVMVNAYDAGTEKNNEQAAYIPGPPFGNFFVRDPDAQLIRRHPGIVNGDLAPYAWQDPVARIEITRMR